MNEKYRNIIIKFLIWSLGFFAIIFIGVNNVFADTITDYGTKYYYYTSNDNSSTAVTEYRYGNDNKVTLYGATAPTYDNGEGFNGFYNSIPYNIIKGNIYTISFTLTFENLQDYEFNQDTMNNRLLSTSFAKSENVQVTAVSGTLRRYNSINPGVSGLYDYSIQISYTVIATETTNNFWLGTYTGDDRSICVNNHTYTSVVMITGLTIQENNSSTIINQNDTIINQNQQMIDQNEQNTQDIINSNNENTNKMINEIKKGQLTCNYKYEEIFEYDKLTNSGYLTSDGELVEHGSFKHSNPTIIFGGNIYNVSGYGTGSANSYFINIYNSSMERLFSFNYKTNSILDLTNYDGLLYIIVNVNSNPLNRIVITKNDNICVPTSYLQMKQNEELNNKLDEQNETSKGILGKLGDLFDNLFSTDDADISGLDNMVGWLPPGPVDSIINLPLSLFNSLTNTLSGTCSPITLTLPFVNQSLTLPCFDTFMSQYLTGFNTLWTWVGVTVSVFILYRYLLNLYKWIDDTLTMRENNLPGYYDDNMWGGA